MSARRASLIALHDTTDKNSHSVVEKTASAREHPADDGSGSDLLRDEAAITDNPFLDPKVAAHYRTIYENAKYECRHIFNPDLEWSVKEERRLIRKLDFRVALLACFMFFALNLDRGNLKQAISDNMLPQLGLSTDQYNYSNTIFYISFLLAELPSQLVSKRLGPDRWIPTQMVLWSVVASSQFWLSGERSFYACRALLGVLEGGFIPDLVLWLSYFYKSRELSLRLSWFWIASDLTVVVASFMAYGLLHMDGALGYAGWRWCVL
ncbi:hypothetical protein LTR86_004204 [Recurvomyces mirabilis]|nr:hypothetical protein LTR86_004204 [Recurvomyces mirabilis]